MISLASVGDDHADAWPGEVETVDALAGRGDFGEDFFPCGDGDFRVVIEVDEPFWVFKHEHVVVRQVRDVKEGFAFGFDAENRVSIGVARGGEDGDRAVEDLVAVFVNHKVGLEGIEGVANVFDHRGNVVGAVGFREVWFFRAPEIEFLAQYVDGGVREKDFTSARQAADVVDVRVTEQGVGDIGEGDADGIHRVGEPAPGGSLMRAEAGINEDDFLVFPQEKNVDIERHVVRAFAKGC